MIRAARASSPADRVLAAVLAAWLLWACLAIAVNGRSLAEGADHLAFPVVLGAGVVLGRVCSRWAGGPVLPAAATAAALAVLVTPLYTNAQAAVGVQLVALVGLMLSATIHGRTGAPRGVGAALLAVVAVVLSGMAGALGVGIALRSQAASLLVLLVAAVVVLALVRPVGVSRRVSAGAGVATIMGASTVTLLLARRRRWPDWLAEGESLSSTRLLLWRDALELWRERPVLGSGPGSFYDHSAIARSEPHLYAAHSSILQVAAEQGLVGALLVLATLVAGVRVATRGDRARGLIGVSAWCALAVHSMIDHLYEFQILVLLAGVVIGWAGSRAREATPRPPGDQGASAPRPRVSPRAHLR